MAQSLNFIGKHALWPITFELSMGALLCTTTRVEEHFDEIILMIKTEPTFPSSIKEYNLGRKLGSGAFGTVHEASLKSGSFGGRFAVDKKLMKTKGMIQRIRNEVAIHHQLRHPNVLELYHFFEDTDRVYLVMEFCPNGELFSYIKRKKGRLAESEARTVFKEIVQAVDYLHLHGIVHRDLKLSNVLFDSNMKPKLADFGLAIRLESNKAEQGTICGTPNYLAPEILGKQPYGVAADQWSLGCILYTCLVGKPPFESTDLRMTFEKVQRTAFQIPFWVSKHAKELITSLIAQDPNSRLTSRQILNHPFIAGMMQALLPLPMDPVPLSTRWLRPIKQSTRHGYVEITSDGDIVVDVASSSDRIRISSDGHQVTTLPKGISDHYGSNLQTFQYPQLPPSCLKLYEYAKRFVEVIRSKSPRLIVNGTRAKCYLMDNPVPGNFLLRYHHLSVKIEYDSDLNALKVIENDRVIQLITDFTQNYVKQVDGELRRHLSDFMEQYARILEMAEGIRHKQDLLQAPFPYVHKDSPAELTRNTAPYQATIPTISILNRTDSVEPEKSLAFIYKTYLSNVGWCLASPDDEFLMLFIDGITALVNGKQNLIGYHDPKRPQTQWFTIQNALPSNVKQKLAYFPKFVQLLQAGYGHTFIE